jgi:5'-nucleotidase
MFKRFAALSAALFLAPATSLAAPVQVQLLALNDLHGNLEAPSRGAGGVEYLATHLKAARASQPNTLVVGAGDMMGASPPLSGLFADAPTIRVLNAIGLDVTSIGNHELDNGDAVFLDRIRGHCPAELKCRPARYAYLAANVMRKDGSPIAAATAVRTVGGIKVGFIGETLRGTGEIISGKAAQALVFKDEAEVANAAARRLKARGVRAIVLLIHQGLFQHPATGPVDINACDNVDGDLLPVLRRLAPDIKVVVSGHTHQAYNCRLDGRLVTGAGAYGVAFSRITLTIDRASDRITGAEAANQAVTHDVAEDPAVTAILDDYRTAAARKTAVAAGTIAAALPKDLDAGGQTALGGMTADSMLAAGRVDGADMALINYGGVRGALAGPEPGAASRTVTYGDLYGVLPFGDRLTTIALTGEQLRRLLEQQFRNLAHPDILQVSEGFSYSFRLNAPEGQRVDPASLMLNGKPIKPGDVVKVTIDDFLRDGANGFSVLREPKADAPGPSDLDAMLAYVATHPQLKPPAPGRVTRAD